MLKGATKPDIVSVLQSYGVSVRAGDGWIPVRCPFHGDSNASASVNPEFGKFKCHGCEVHGDAWDLIQTREGCTLQEAILIGKTFATSGIVVLSEEPKTKPQHKPRGRRGRI